MARNPLVVEDVCRYTIVGRWTNGHTVATIMDYQIDTTGSSQSRAEAIIAVADDVIQNWQSQVMQIMANNYTVEEIQYLDLNSLDGISGTRPPDSGEDTVGQDANSHTPPNNAVFIKKNIAGGRGKRSGRFFLPGIRETQVDEDGVLDPAYMALIQTECDDFLANTTQDALDIDGHQSRLVVVHLDPVPEEDEEPRNGTYTPVNNLAVQSLSSTQRRRLR